MSKDTFRASLELSRKVGEHLVANPDKHRVLSRFRLILPELNPIEKKWASLKA